MRLQCTEALDTEDAAALSGTLLGEDSYDLLIDDDADVYRPDGQRLLSYRRHGVEAALCKMAFNVLRRINVPPTNRFLAVAGGTSPRPIVRAGYRSSTHRLVSTSPAVKGASSAIIGYYDRAARFPFCRQTAFTMHQPGPWRRLLPFLAAVSDLFRSIVPERWVAQRGWWDRTAVDFRIPDSVFTTVTVNKNWQTRVHKDAGDLVEGFGVMCALRGGAFSGGHLVFPRYRVAVDMRTTGVLMADVHEWHGNTPLVGNPGRFTRVSCVFYYRTAMRHCGTAEEELSRVRQRRRGEPLGP